MKSLATAPDSRGLQFIPFASFGSFAKTIGTNANILILTSPEIQTRIRWDELIASWNVEMKSGAGLKVEARAIYPERTTKWFNLGLWSADPTYQPRQSVKRQKDADGDVDTDTLLLNQPAERVQVRVTLDSGGKRKPKLKFLSLSLLDSKATREPLPSNRKAWGKTIDVLERSQMAYKNGDVLCSPTTVSMLLSHWSQQLGRPGLNCDVPEVVQGVYDPTWGGTGNWVFNTAYAGSFRWMRAYTTRLSDVAELEGFIAKGIPVGLSLCYNRLRGKSREPSGHLVVCVGFTKNGDVIINDPGTSKHVRKIFPRANLIDAWAYSKNAAYLIYPVNMPLPQDKFGHWESLLAKRAIQLAR
ncbi:MAG: C39 family peptidase [Verrucomicrobiota bacterium]